MTLAIVAYPTLNADDRLWIESFRTAHDPQANRIGVHFTLVFPFDSSPVDLETEIVAVTRSTPPIDFVVRRAHVVPDVIGDGYRVFLTPVEAAGEIAKIHDRLYAGTLQPHLRRDIPYVPHMTMAAAPDAAVAEALAYDINRHRRVVHGTVDHLTFIDVSEPEVQFLARYGLGAG